MKYSIFLLLFVLLGISACATDKRVVVEAHCMEADPINGQVTFVKMLDTTGDGNEEEVVIYTVNGDIFLEIFQSTEEQRCNPIYDIELGDLNLVDRQMRLEVIDLELIDMTGDDLPELHVGYEKSGAGRYAAGAVDQIYQWNAPEWERIFVTDACLQFNTFEIHDDPSSGMKQIFYQNDRVCDSVDGRRDYEIFQWNGEKFEVLETGIREIPFWEKSHDLTLYLFSLLCLLPFIPIGVYILFVLAEPNQRETPV